MNTCIFDNFDFDCRHLSFDVIVKFDGIDPISHVEYYLQNEILHWNVVFSEDLEYNSYDVYKMITEYIRQAKLHRRFDDVNVNLEYSGNEYDYSNGTDYLMFNSGGIDAASIFLTIKQEMGNKLHTIEINHTYDTTTARNCRIFNYVNDPIILTFTEEHNVRSIISNPCNSIWLRHLCYRKYNIKQTIYGDVTPVYKYNYHKVYDKDVINFAFYENQAVSEYIAYKLSDFNTIMKIMADNYWPKVIRKMVYTMIFMRQMGDINHDMIYEFVIEYIKKHNITKNKYDSKSIHALEKIIIDLRHEHDWYINKLFGMENDSKYVHQYISVGIRKDIFDEYFYLLGSRCNDLRDILTKVYYTIGLQWNGNFNSQIRTII